MGYCYQGRRLCCDFCSTPGARKHKCPFNWCHATAACAQCRVKHKEHFSKDSHRQNGCEVRHNEFMADREREAALLSQGKYLRISALDAGERGIHVLFRHGGGQVIGRYMAAEVYQALPLGKPATLDDFGSRAQLLDAPPEYSWGSTTKQAFV